MFATNARLTGFERDVTTITKTQDKNTADREHNFDMLDARVRYLETQRRDR